MEGRAAIPSKTWLVDVKAIESFSWQARGLPPPAKIEHVNITRLLKSQAARKAGRISISGGLDGRRKLNP